MFPNRIRTPNRLATSIALPILLLLIGALLATAPVSTAQPSGWTPCAAGSGTSCLRDYGYSGQRTWGYPVDGTGSNCTNYAAFRLAQRGVANPGNLGNGNEWAGNASAKGIPVNQTPQVGSVAQWTRINHVAFVDAVSADGNTIWISESHWGGGSNRMMVQRGNSYWPQNFIHFAGSVTPPPPTPVDDDRDGVVGAADICPWEAGPAATDGCQVPVVRRHGDFDSDKNQDVFWANPTDGKWYFSPAGSGPNKQINQQSAPPDQLRIGDMDGDGKPDIFWANPADGKWYVSYHGGRDPWQIINQAGVPFDQLKLADLDGDGKDDVFWANPRDGKWYACYNGGRCNWKEINSANVPHYQLQLADLDGDGKDDVFWANPRDGKWYACYNGGRCNWKEINSANVPFYQLQLGDLDGDKKADIFWANPRDGKWYLCTNGGRCNWKVINQAGVPWTQLRLSDLNGDGKDDVWWDVPYTPDNQRWVSWSGTSTWKKNWPVPKHGSTTTSSPPPANPKPQPPTTNPKPRPPTTNPKPRPPTTNPRPRPPAPRPSTVPAPAPEAGSLGS